MIIVDVPVSFESDTYYSTVPLGIVKTDRMLLTLCTQELNVFSKRLKVTTTSINAHIYQILYTISIQYVLLNVRVAKLSVPYVTHHKMKI